MKHLMEMTLALASMAISCMAAVPPVHLLAVNPSGETPLPLSPTTRPLPPGGKRILILTGMEYPGHPWRQTAPFLKEVIEKDPRMLADVQPDPKFLASPDLHNYDAMVLNYMNWQSPDPGDAARENLRKFVDSGKGLVLVHFACGAFQGWGEFVKIAGRVYDPKLRPHDPRGPFSVHITDGDHAITKGMKDFDTDDELYTCLAGDTPMHIIASATSKVDKKDYPMVFVLNYGKGRVCHNVLGHDVKALKFDGVQDLYRRGTAWVAGLEPK